MSLPSQRPRTSRQRIRRTHTRRPKDSFNLPTEILLNITSHLSKPTWLSLRLVSRSLYAFSSNLPLITSLWFGPYSEDLSVFQNVCNHPFLGSHVTTILYDVTRFEDLSIEELREHWPRPKRGARERPREPRRKWIENHVGVWQYLKLVEELKAGSFDRDEVRILADGMKKLPNLRTIRLAFAFQQQGLVTDRERMSPLKRYSDVEYVTRTPVSWKIQRRLVDERMVRNILDTITLSGVYIEELDLWRDYISVPLNAFNLEERFDGYSAIFSRLTSLTIKVAQSSMESASDLGGFRKLLGMAKGLRRLHLSVDGPEVHSHREKMPTLRLLVEDSTMAQLREAKWVEQPDLLGPSRIEMFEYDPPWPGTVWILERRVKQ
ncbi:hypothetical protein N431DRAFT_369389 [Stipitochalara longipes BDJ]|nr:hypothetical protein N431DRAFT_369389 [Stipitochalara longipes BDJ]